MCGRDEHGDKLCLVGLRSGLCVQYALWSVLPAIWLPHGLRLLRRILLLIIKTKRNHFMKPLCFVAFLFCMIGAAACSPEAFNAATSTSATGATAACSTGYVYTSAYGCGPQSTCSTGYALYNGQCISTTATPTATPTPTTVTTVTCPSG
jgi:hypothetical protein